MKQRIAEVNHENDSCTWDSHGREYEQMNAKQVIDFTGLAALVRGYRESKSLKLREAANECGVSSSTLSRIERAEARPDLDTVQALVNWIGVPLERVTTAALTSKHPPLRQRGDAISSVEIQFRADPDLAPEAAEALIKIVKEAYAVMKIKGRGR
jgi:transcriptional regulator with XRE-family HTH domain